MEDKEIIDYGEIHVPSSWDEITLKTYQRIEEYYESITGDTHFNVMDVLDIFIDKDKDYLMSLPTEFLDIILDKLSFLTTPMKTPEPSNKIEINGEKYIVNVQNKLKTGEFIASDSILKDDRHNYAAMLAILCRKEGEIYDLHFENEVVQDRITLFEQQPITKIMPIITFFLALYGLSVMTSQLSSKVEEAIDLTRRNIETSHKNGEISRRSMKSAMKKLKKLEQSIKCM
jgi:hypothetical protein